MPLLVAPKVTRIKCQTLTAGPFVSASRNLRCQAYRPVDRLAQAFERYGILEIYADGLSKTFLDRPDLARDFGRRAQAGISLEENLELAFKGQGALIFIHEDGPLSIVANRKTLTALKELDPYRVLTRAEQLEQVIAEESGRDSERPSNRPTLDDYEGNIWSANQQGLLAGTINAEPFEETNPDLIMRDHLRGRR